MHFAIIIDLVHCFTCQWRLACYLLVNIIFILAYIVLITFILCLCLLGAYCFYVSNTVEVNLSSFHALAIIGIVYVTNDWTIFRISPSWNTTWYGGRATLCNTDFFMRNIKLTTEMYLIGTLSLKQLALTLQLLFLSTTVSHKPTILLLTQLHSYWPTQLHKYQLHLRYMLERATATVQSQNTNDHISKM